MIESLLSFEEINDRPYIMLLWAFIICIVAILVSSQIASSIAGIDTGFFTVVFIMIPSVYFITMLIKREEEMEEEQIKKHYKRSFWERHNKDLLILLFYFAGLTLAFSIMSFFLPSDFFHVQLSKINELHAITGSFSQNSSFITILFNNLQVMFISFLFSFIFGAGAVFIIIWNASVLGVYVGQLSKSLWHIPIVSLSFLPHGIPEIAGYLCAGLAGGILSAVILRKNTTKVFEIVVFDCIKILLLGVFLIIVGAGIEAFI